MASQTSTGAQIAAWFRQQGLSAAAAAGLAGNFQIESGFDPGATNPRENAIGLAQWQRGRRTNLQAYARETGGTEASLTTQLGFVMRELTGPFRSVLDRINAAGSAGEAAAIVDQSYEISSGAARSQRVAAAQSIAAGGGGSVAGNGQSIVDQASTYLGIPYVWGGVTRFAVDCSGLVLQVFRDLGVTVPRTSAQQSKVGTRIASMDQAQPGDLLFFGSSENNITHVGIYDGNGKMTHAPQPGENVKVGNVYETPKVIRRIATGASSALGIGAGIDTNTPLLPGGQSGGTDSGSLVTSFLDTSFEDISRWLANAGIVILGAVLIIIALVFVAKGGESAAGGTDPDDRSSGGSTHSPIARAARLAA